MTVNAHAIMRARIKNAHVATIAIMIYAIVAYMLEKSDYVMEIVA